MVFAGALLENAEELLRMGLSPSEVVEGYEMACQKALELLPSKGDANIYIIAWFLSLFLSLPLPFQLWSALH